MGRDHGLAGIVAMAMHADRAFDRPVVECNVTVMTDADRARENEQKRYQRRAFLSCKVCGAVPDVEGCIEHSRACFTQSEDGGGVSFVDLPPDLRVVGDLGITLESLLGMYVLDAVGESVGYDAGGRGDDGHDARVFYARIDGEIYRFAEDTQDGYRSCLSELAIVREAPLVPFPPMTVSVHWHPAPHNNDVIYFVNEATDLVVLEIGTVNTDDYYPSFVSHWVPEGHEPQWRTNAEEQDP